MSLQSARHSAPAFGGRREAVRPRRPATAPLPLGLAVAIQRHPRTCNHPRWHMQALVKAAEQLQQRAERKRGAQAAELHAQAVVSRAGEGRPRGQFRCRVVSWRCPSSAW